MRTNITQKKILALLFMLMGFFAEHLQAQTENPCDERSTYLYWVGGSSNDFFDEMNWRLANRKIFSSTDGTTGEPECKPGMQPQFVICLRDFNPEKDKIPAAGTLEPGTPIPYNLYLPSADVTINNPLIFSCIDKGITLQGSKLKVNAEVRGTMHLDNNSTVRIGTPSLGDGLRISLQDHHSWVYFDKILPSSIAQMPLSSWMISLQVPVSLSSLLINQYYQNGSIVRRNPADYKPLTIYDGTGFEGSSTELGIHSIHAGSSIPDGMNRKTRSFKLRRGFMATLATKSNGTGMSQVYIASEKDLEVPELPASLSGNISFIRVLPWNWTTKKGTGGYFAGNPLDAGWFYTWSATQNTQLNYEYVPMTWGAGTTNPAGMKAIVDKNNVTHLLGFNESDNCSGESGQYLNLCQPEVAVAYYERLMGSGLRLGTPAPRENGPTTWLRQFAALAKERNVRFDFVAVHWYDWGSNPSNSPFADPVQVFNRFKAYLQQVYNEYKLPIWITEFNANPNRDNSVHAAFLELALPYLETLPYVERYAYFQPNPANATTTVASAYYYDNANNLTNIGQIYLNHNSTSSMPDSTYECENNLNGLNQPLPVMQEQRFVFEAECGKYPGSKWTVGEDEAASNGKYLKGNTLAAGETTLATQVHYDFDVTEEAPFRIWQRTKANSGIVVIQIDHDRFDTIRSVNSSNFEWQSVPRLYTFKPGTHRVSLALVNNTTQFDQVAIIAGSDDVNSPLEATGYCEPEAFIWGQSAPSDPIFAEAETAMKGINWSNASNDKAIGGLFVQCGAFTSPNVAPSADGWLTFSIDVSAAGAYQFWTKLQTLDVAATQLWIKIDDDEFQPWTGLQKNNYLWKWQRYDPATAGLTRQEYLFLQPGTHTVTIAYASGGIKIDRVALMPAGNLPAAIDPDVVIETGPQSYEAEEATLVGTAAIVTCATSSNGKQVNLLNVGTNGVRFSKVLAGSAGTYQLVIHYMSAAIRSLRVFVNGTQLPTQRMAISGAWCFNNGTPGTWYMSVKLNPGENAIEFRPVAGNDAPFVDKIEVRPVIASFEAELAQLTGTNAIVNCTSASNGQFVNMGSTITNSVQFNNISVPATGTYNLNISYFSEPARTMKMTIDNDGGTNLSFAPSGAWCFNSGVPVVKSVQVYLTQGIHTIRFQPNSGEAPIVDKIDLVETTIGDAPITNSTQTLEADAVASMSTSLPAGIGKLYPNPARSGATIHIPLQKHIDRKTATIILYDARGAMIGRKTNVGSSGYTLPYIKPGIYFLQVEEAGQTKAYRIMVQ